MAVHARFRLRLGHNGAVSSLGAELGIAVVAFAGTNVDNCIVTTTMVAGAPVERAHRIAVGQVLGFVVLVAGAAAAAVLLFEVPTAAVGLLGLVPLAVGLRGLLELWRSGRAHAGAVPRTERVPARAVGRSLVAAALVTVAAGGDNVAVYIPLFRAAGAGDAGVLLGVFALGEVAVTALVLWGGRHRRARAVMTRLGATAVPVMLCCIGVLVLLEAGTLARL